MGVPDGTALTPRRRIERGYRAAVAARLRRQGVAEAEALARRIVDRALARAARGGRDARLELARTYARVQRRLPEPPAYPPDRFVCDGSLGALARWLRAAGYEAEACAGQRAEEALREARGSGAVLITTDHEILDRSVVRDGAVPVVWVPSGQPPTEQLAHVVCERGLTRRAPRCMPCGGPLVPVPREVVAERVPPRTAAWLDAYEACARCDALFWRGTHWERIATRLAHVRWSPGRIST